MPSQKVISLLVLEYEQLKEEQRMRISTRDNLVYTVIGAIALIVAATAQTGSARFLVLVPPVCAALGWTYLVNDDRVTAIGAYLRDVLAPELTRRSASDTELFRWERHHREDAGRTTRKAFQLAIDLLVFCVVGIAALVFVWSSARVPLALHATMLAELAGLAALAFRFIKASR